MENHGFPFAKRWPLLRERIEALKTIWTEHEASYSGEFINFDRIISNPKPFQNPHPPILMGGATKSSLRRVAHYCDGWIPIDALLKEPSQMVKKLYHLVKSEGRDPQKLLLSVFCQLNKDLETLKIYEDAGFNRAIIALPNRAYDETLQIEANEKLKPILSKINMVMAMAEAKNDFAVDFIKSVDKYVRNNYRITKKQMEGLNKVYKRVSENLFKGDENETK